VSQRLRLRRCPQAQLPLVQHWTQGFEPHTDFLDAKLFVGDHGTTFTWSLFSIAFPSDFHETRSIIFAGALT
jgi:hypothetical protein